MSTDRTTKLRIAVDWRDLSAAAYLWKDYGERIADDLDQMDRVRGDKPRRRGYDKQA